MERKKRIWIFKPVYSMLDGFNYFQDGLENFYERFLKKVVRHPLLSLGISFLVFVGTVASIAFIPKTFLPPQEFAEFSVLLEGAPGMNLGTMHDEATQVDQILHSNPEVAVTVMTVGDRDGQANKTSFYVSLVSEHDRTLTTTQVKDKIRKQLSSLTHLSPKVTDYDPLAQGLRPFNINILGEDLDALEKYSAQVFENIKNHPALLDPEISHKPGKPEVQLVLNQESSEEFGVTTDMVGLEVRTLVEGEVPAVFRQAGKEYDIRIRAQENQRNVTTSFNKILVPNINHTLVPLNLIATLKNTNSPVTINRDNRTRYIQISGDIKPGSSGLGGLINDSKKLLEKTLPLPPGMSYKFVGQAEDFQELLENMLIALLLGILFIYFVLASLYESFITPLTIMLVMPLAACGAFLALLITQQSLDIFSIIGCILLMGVASKNSILLVDYTHQLMEKGVGRADALVQAGKARLRPILMTSLALIAGMIPIAIGLNEASKQRVSMGIAVIGGMVSSTFLSLIVIPAAFSYMDRLNTALVSLFRRKVSGLDDDEK